MNCPHWFFREYRVINAVSALSLTAVMRDRCLCNWPVNGAYAYQVEKQTIDFITEISSQNMPEINTFNCFLAYVIKSDFGCLFWQPEGCRAENSSRLCISETCVCDESVRFGLQQLIWIAQTANWLSKPVSCVYLSLQNKKYCGCTFNGTKW